MLKNKKRMSFEELELIVEEIDECEKAIARLRCEHIEIVLGNISFDTIEEKNRVLSDIEFNIDFLIAEIQALREGELI